MRHWGMARAYNAPQRDTDRTAPEERMQKAPKSLTLAHRSVGNVQRLNGPNFDYLAPRHTNRRLVYGNRARLRALTVFGRQLIALHIFLPLTQQLEANV